MPIDNNPITIRNKIFISAVFGLVIPLLEVFTLFVFWSVFGFVSSFFGGVGCSGSLGFVPVGFKVNVFVAISSQIIG